MMFAIDDACTIADIRKRNANKCKMAKGWKIPTSKIKPSSLAIINGTFTFTEVKKDNTLTASTFAPIGSTFGLS